MKPIAILIRLLGRERAYAIQFFAIEWAFFILAGLLFAVLSATVFLKFRPSPHHHVSYVTAEVVGVLPAASTQKFKVMVDARLPDGTPVRLTTSRGAIAGAIVDTACVEQRQHRDSGKVFYLLAMSQKCANQQ